MHDRHALGKCYRVRIRGRIVLETKEGLQSQHVLRNSVYKTHNDIFIRQQFSSKYISRIIL